MKKVALVAILLSVFMANVPNHRYFVGNKYYVSSSTGNDANACSISSPCKTVAHVMNVLNPGAGDSVFLKGGDVFNETLYAHSGISGQPMVFSTYGTGRAIVSGATTLSSWTNMGNGVYETLCAGCSIRTNMVTLDAIPMSMGRWPDTGYNTYTAITSTTITDATLATAPYNWTGAQCAVHDEFYIIDTVSITAQSTSQLTFDIGLSNTDSRGAGYFVFNDPRTLQITHIVGRWYNNTTTDSLQMYFGSAGPSGHTVVVSTKDTLFYASVKSYVSVNNIDFEYSNQYSVFENNTSNITITNCLFNYGGRNMFTGNNCPNAWWFNDTCNYFLNNGAWVTGSSSTYPEVQNCYFNHIGLIPGMGVGSGNGIAGYTGWSQQTSYGGVYANNTWLNTGYDALFFSGDSCFVYGNVIDTFCLTKLDGGGIYTTDASFINYTYRRWVYNNLILHGGASQSGVNFDPSDASFGLYTDGHSSFLELLNNLCAFNGSGGYLNHGSNMTVTGNLFYGNGYVQMVCSESTAAVIAFFYRHNTMVNSNATQYSVLFTTPNADLTTMAQMDSNTYVNYPVDTLVFFTKSSTDGGTYRGFYNWQTTSGYDTHSSLNQYISKLFWNTQGHSTRTLLQGGGFEDITGAQYYGTLYLSPYGYIPLYYLSGIPGNEIIVPYGVQINVTN